MMRKGDKSGDSIWGASETVISINEAAPKAPSPVPAHTGENGFKKFLGDGALI